MKHKVVPIALWFLFGFVAMWLLSSVTLGHSLTLAQTWKDPGNWVVPIIIGVMASLNYLRVTKGRSRAR